MGKGILEFILFWRARDSWRIPLELYPPRLGTVRERLTDTGITNMMILARLDLHWKTDEQRIGYVATQTRIVNRANV